MQNTEKSLIRSFGRVRGKKLSARQQFLVDNLLPELLPTWGESAQHSCAGGGQVLEIGFGAGEHLMHIAREHPNHTIIGAEPFVNGVASLLSQITEGIRHKTYGIDIIKPEYRNIRIWNDDVRKLLCPMPYALCPINLVFDKIYILHPDPWPKDRHHKRRILQTEFLNELARHLAPGGQIIIGTDHLDLFDWIVEQVKKSKLTIHNSQFTTPPEAGLDTRYKTKDMFGANACRYLVLGKK